MSSQVAIRCVPRGLFSWNFELSGHDQQALLEFAWLGEGGRITIDGVVNAVAKESLLKGQWSLTESDTQRFRPAEPVLNAHKVSAFMRTFEITSPDGLVMLEAQSIWSRVMTLRGAGFGAELRPRHMFTRGSVIEGEIPDFRTACFAFWLAVLLWRRQAQSD